MRFFATAARVARVTSLAIVAVLALPGMASGQATPGEPTNPSLTVGISGQVVLSWEPPATDGGSAITTYYYRLRETGRRWSSGRPWDDIGLVTTVTITDLTDGTSYDIQVTARNSSGETGIALDFQVTPGTAPAAINDLSAAAGNKQATLSWTLPGDGGPPITGFQYRQKTSASYGSWMDIPNSGSGTKSQTVADLANSTVYTFQVRAVNDAGEADASNEAEVTTTAAADDCAGGSGTFCSVTLGTSVSGSIEVGGDSDWFELMGQVGGGATYQIDLRGAPSNNGTLEDPAILGMYTKGKITELNPAGHFTGTFNDDISAGNKESRVIWTAPADIADYFDGDPVLYIAVRGSNFTDTGTYTLTVIVSSGPSPPGAPTGLAATAAGPMQINLLWTAPGGNGGAAISGYRIEVSTDGGTMWSDAVADTGSTITTYSHTGRAAGTTYHYRVSAINAMGAGTTSALARVMTPESNTGGGGTGGGGGDSGPRQTVPGAPTNLVADGGNEQVTLSWDAPEDDGGFAITDYEVRINGRGSWISIDSTRTAHTVTGLTIGTAYVFQVRAVNRIGRSFSSNRAEATPGVGALDFAHFANGEGITSDLVFVNVAPHPIRPVLYFYDQEGNLIDPASVVDLTEDLEVTEDGSLSVRTEMEPLGELTVSTHGRGEVVSGSVKVVSNGPIGGVLRFDLPGIGVAGVGASPPVRDALFPARREVGGISTAAAVHNIEEEAIVVSCRLMSGGVVLEEMEISLAANGQEAQFIEEMFTTTDTSNFVGLVRCTGPGRFTGVAVELDAANRIFTTLPVVPVNLRGRGREAVLDFAHFANGEGITSDLVFVNVETQPSGPAPTPYHTAIPPIRPALYFYDKEGNPIAAESVVEITGDLEVRADGGLSVRTEMEPLGELTISTHGQGELVSGSVRVVSDGPIGGVLRFDLPGIGVAGVGASQSVRDALFPVRRQAGGISTAAAIHNPGGEAMAASCRLMKEGTVLEEVEIPLDANGQEARYIEELFPRTDTSDFVGSVRCTAPGEGAFTGVAVELDASNQIFTTLPVVPVPERVDQE